MLVRGWFAEARIAFAFYKYAMIFMHNRIDENVNEPWSDGDDFQQT